MCATHTHQVISGLRGVDVDGHRFFDGGVAELVPDITPEQVGGQYQVLRAGTGR